MKNYYVFDIEYSQTDKSVIIICAENKRQCDIILKRRYPNARYYNLIRQTDNFHNN